MAASLKNIGYFQFKKVRRKNISAGRILLVTE